MSEPKRYPVLPIRDMVLFPGIIAPLFVGRPRSLKALEAASSVDKMIVVVAQNDSRVDDPKPQDLYDVGTLCQILQIVRIPDGTTKVLVEGSQRMRIAGYQADREYISALCEPLADQGTHSERVEPLRRSVFEQFDRYANLHPKIPVEVSSTILSVENPSLFTDLVTSHMLVQIAEKQRLLETPSSEERLESLLRLLLREVDLLETERNIQDRVRQEMEKGHREYYLKEQLKAIQDELGGGGEISEVGEYKSRIKKAKMPKETEKKALHELSRFEKMPPMSAEATVVRTYIDWLVDMPWRKQTPDCLDIKSARAVLEADHYGLDEVKERILEFLAVRKLAGKKTRGQVLCFVGPPGVGKTSLGKSIARALNREFVNMSLGGMRDEAEIRGHRRTYIGALPGRIIQKVKQAGVRNPVLLLDEIDKVGSDFRGDPSAALLEVLDPEQNHSFTDHFLEVPFDLSHVMFITTANGTYTIPRPLLDRMELIHLPGYVTEEKINIAKRYLWPKIAVENGLEKIKVTISDKTYEHIITSYTREAGVRNLDRQLSKVARKLAMEAVERNEEKKKPLASIAITQSKLPLYLKSPRIHAGCLPKGDFVGAAVGLAWTENGGDILVIEAAVMQGSGKVSFTGNLGDIMQESAQAALGYLRSKAEDYSLQAFKWEEKDIHVHVPEGAIPKDGPSAGVTLALALMSSVTGIPVRSDRAMTGEITLRGMVLPIGGVREKVLAAKRYGIHTVLLPKENRTDVDELAPWAKEGMDFHFVSHVREIFDLALAHRIQNQKKRPDKVRAKR